MEYCNYIVKPGTELAKKLESWLDAKLSAHQRAREFLVPYGVSEYKMGSRLIAVKLDGSKSDNGVWKRYKISGWYVPEQKAPKELRDFWKNHKVPNKDDLENSIIGHSFEFLDIPEIGHLITGRVDGVLILRVPAVRGTWKPNPEDVDEITITRIQELEDKAKEGGKV